MNSIQERATRMRISAWKHNAKALYICQRHFQRVGKIPVCLLVIQPNDDDKSTEKFTSEATYFVAKLNIQTTWFACVGLSFRFPKSTRRHLFVTLHIDWNIACFWCWLSFYKTKRLTYFSDDSLESKLPTFTTMVRTELRQALSAHLMICIAC